jgi:hypothetical protein
MEMSVICHRLYVRHLYLAKLLFWWGMYRTGVLSWSCICICPNKMNFENPSSQWKIKPKVTWNCFKLKIIFRKSSNFKLSQLLHLKSKSQVLPLVRKVLECAMIPVFKVLPVFHWKYTQILNLSRCLVLSRNQFSSHQLNRCRLLYFSSSVPPLLRPTSPRRHIVSCFLPIEPRWAWCLHFIFR